MRDLKRILDAAAAAGLLVALFPVFALIALVVRWTSPGPALFRQRRVGWREAPFELLKFRSMCVDAPLKGSWSTAPGDPRITPVGRFLRRTSLDELPQLVNILRGDMSLVGPRPDVPAQMSLYSDEERRLRHSVRPGLTGWAQVNGRNEMSLERRKALDLEYARKSGLRLDLRILYLTLRQALSHRSY